MLSRREVLRFAAALPLLSCSRASKPTWPRRAVYGGVDVIELFPRDALEASPLVIAIHGRGDRPENWVDSWRTFPAPVRIVLPRASHAFGDGWSWFDLRDGMTDAELGAAVGEAEARLWTGLAKLAGGRRMLVTGFSQGGILSFAIAARHPDAVAKAFPVSGSCPGPLLPRNKARAAPLVAFHGTADPVIAFKWGRGAVDAFKEQGDDATLHEYPGVGHTITPAMRADLWAEIQRALPLVA
jgi:phospholipase/carboxylesterase